MYLNTSRPFRVPVETVSKEATFSPTSSKGFSSSDSATSTCVNCALLLSIPSTTRKSPLFKPTNASAKGFLPSSGSL